MCPARARYRWQMHMSRPMHVHVTIFGFGLVEMAISTNPKPTIYRNLYENTGPGDEQENALWKIAYLRGAKGTTIFANTKHPPKKRLLSKTEGHCRDKLGDFSFSPAWKVLSIMSVVYIMRIYVLRFHYLSRGIVGRSTPMKTLCRTAAECCVSVVITGPTLTQPFANDSWSLVYWLLRISGTFPAAHLSRSPYMTAEKRRLYPPGRRLIYDHRWQPIKNAKETHKTSGDHSGNVWIISDWQLRTGRGSFRPQNLTCLASDCTCSNPLLG